MNLFRLLKFTSLSIVFLVSLIFLQACGSGVDPQPGGVPSPENADGFSAPLPQPLQKHLNATGLRAELVVDGGAPIPLTIDLAGNRVTGTAENLSPGSHTFVINYFLNNVVVATATTTGNITAGQTTPIGFVSVRYLDSDGDGFTNLAEVESGFDPLLSSSRPASELPRFSANYVMSDAVGLAPMVGGAASSANYTMTSGF